MKKSEDFSSTSIMQILSNMENQWREFRNAAFTGHCLISLDAIRSVFIVGYSI